MLFMFKNFIYLLMAVCLLACSKTRNKPMTYSIEDVQDVHYNFHAISLPISFTKISGDKENIVISITGLPNGMKGVFSVDRFNPDFTVVLNLEHDTFINGGIYPLKISAISSSGVVKSDLFNLTIPDSCGGYFAGEYTLIRTLINASGTTTDTSYYTALIKQNSPNEIYFTRKNWPDMFSGVVVDCDKKIININGNSASKYTTSFTMSPTTIYINDTNSYFKYRSIQRYIMK